MAPLPEANEPKLEAPGAGLPLPQRLFLRYWLGPVVSKRKPREECRVDYERITEKLIKKVSAVSPESRKIRVLVEPMPGLEDSSRYWSLNGVMEHLLTVSKSIESGILSLCSGRIPEGKADVAKVKPKNPGHDYFSEFTEYAPSLMKRLDEALLRPGKDFHSPLKFRHPWFGEMTARQYYWLLGSHQGVHYRQAKEIIRGL